MEFYKFNFENNIYEALELMNFKNLAGATKAIPKILDGDDIIACAQTGTEKQQLLYYQF